ncbi:MAG: UvrD-helicase domain-containing protein, partial [Spirochaetales bacterium]|nr:UvrD-helicase domain-containing protein [Spirochaetales bacterium]
LGLYVLKHDIASAGYGNKFSIYDDKDCMKIIKDILLELRLPEDDYDPYQTVSKMSLLKMNLGSGFDDPNYDAIFQKYQYNLKLHNAVDFDDLIKLPLEIFQRNPDILRKYQKKWDYILVDEYQDTSLMQYRFMKCLAEQHRNISVVGDDDQSIYSWRGAVGDIFALFEKDFAPVYEVRLEQNYRSTGNILAAANAIIKNNVIRKDKVLWTSGEAGEKITYYEASDEDDEALFVRNGILEYKNKGYKLSDVGILFRQNFQSRPLEEAMREYNLPYKIIGSMKFFDREEIRDIMAYLRFLANQDDEVAFIRIINNPKRGIGNVTLQSIMEFAREANCSLYSGLKYYIDNNVLPKATPYLEDFYNLIEKYKSKVFKPKNIARTVRELVAEIDYQSKLLADLKVLSKVSMRMNNINQLSESIARYENDPDNFDPNLYDYLQKIMLAQKDDGDDESNQINMMTIHASKGLEFKVVFIVGLEDGLIPSSRAVEDTGSDAEERRLFYVAVTRAREKLFLSYPASRGRFGVVTQSEPSPFISEIPEELLITEEEEETDPDEKLAALLKSWESK